MSGRFGDKISRSRRTYLRMSSRERGEKDIKIYRRAGWDLCQARSGPDVWSAAGETVKASRGVPKGRRLFTRLYPLDAVSSGTANCLQPPGPPCGHWGCVMRCKCNCEWDVAYGNYQSCPNSLSTKLIVQRRPKSPRRDVVPDSSEQGRRRDAMRMRFDTIEVCACKEDQYRDSKSLMQETGQRKQMGGDEIDVAGKWDVSKML
jgi:hypothetical protein